MKKYIFKPYVLIALVALVAGLSACKDDEGPKNQFTADGDSFSLSNGSYYISDQGEDEDGNMLYEHIVYLTSGTLEIEDGDLIGKGNLFAFSLIGSEDDIAAGTYEMKDALEAGVIDLVMIYGNVDVGSGSYDKIFGGNVEGTIKVSKSGNKHTFQINFTKYQTLNEDGETVTVEGSLKGYFKGELTVITDADMARKQETDFKSLFKK